ncbi:hypothetical protein NBZ79_00255 [Sneathiella marina]|uniref:Uncharacterized protein n=1 Tax=Sneathiella marina TaxID=2950108 RepID=A0ABY4W9T6_9PROT|nr:hypothetical protein [Sneathiella marina]USG61406.1 hypothetical protein NBZ79_00255 [Sneathiella marina]
MAALSCGAVRALGRITSRVEVEDSLEEVFGDYCIGIKGFISVVIWARWCGFFQRPET